MRKKKSLPLSLSLVGMFLGCCLVLPGTLGARGTIAGLRISNPSVVGTTLSFDVTLSVTSSIHSPGLGFLGDRYHRSSFSTSTTQIINTHTNTYTTTYVCGTHVFTTHQTCVGPPPTSSTYPCNTNTYTTYAICAHTNTSTYQTTLTHFYSTHHTTGYTILNPLLPAIDWGDGNTIPHTTLPRVGSGSPQVYRGSFSHAYASTGGYTVKVGAFGRDQAATLNGGNVTTVNVPDSFKYESYHRTINSDSGSPTDTNTNYSTQTMTSPDHYGVGVTASASFGVPVELQTFTVARASQTMGSSHHGSPFAVAGLGLGSLLTLLGFVLLRKE